MINIEGRIEVGEYDESARVVLVNSNGNREPLADNLDGIQRKQVTVRYWLSAEPMSREDAETSVLKVLDGTLDARYAAQYSEATGYLWTDEWFKVGGHDLLAEIGAHDGEWLHMEIEIHSTPAV